VIVTKRAVAVLFVTEQADSVVTVLAGAVYAVTDATVVISAVSSCLGSRCMMVLLVQCLQFSDAEDHVFECDVRSLVAGKP